MPMRGNNLWYFTKEQLQRTPSVVDGINPIKEKFHRREATKLIRAVGEKLNLPTETYSTASVFFHRFFMYHSFTNFDKYTVAIACLFFAGKVEETPKKCKDLVRQVQLVLSERSESHPYRKLEPRKVQDDVMRVEKVLLQTLKFDFRVDCPHKFLLEYSKVIKGDKERLKMIYGMAWAFANDSYMSTLPLRWEPEIIAIAAIYLSCRMKSYQIKEFEGRNSRCRKWWDLYVDNMTNEILDEICHDLLDVYEDDKPSSIAKGNSDGSSTPLEEPDSCTMDHNYDGPTTPPSGISLAPKTPDQSNYQNPAPPPPPPKSVKPPPPPPSKNFSLGQDSSHNLTQSMPTNETMKNNVKTTDPKVTVRMDHANSLCQSISPNTVVPTQSTGINVMNPTGNAAVPITPLQNPPFPVLNTFLYSNPGMAPRAVYSNIQYNFQQIRQNVPQVHQNYVHGFQPNQVIPSRFMMIPPHPSLPQTRQSHPPSHHPGINSRYPYRSQPLPPRQFFRTNPFT